MEQYGVIYDYSKNHVAIQQKGGRVIISDSPTAQEFIQDRLKNKLRILGVPVKFNFWCDKIIDIEADRG